MDDLNITINNSSFIGESSVIRNLYDAPESTEIDFNRIIKELQEIKAGLRSDTIDFQVVDTLERPAEKGTGMNFGLLRENSHPNLQMQHWPI